MGLWSDRVLPELVDRVCGREVIAEERARWVPRAHGRVLEIGLGSGLNLPFYDAARVDRVVGVDPSGALLRRAQARADASAVDVRVVAGAAEALPFEAASFDSAVMTYTLCSVADPRGALAEIARVLRPGGELFFIEHGLAPGGAPRAVQRVLTPAWRLVAGNCHLDRDVLADLEASPLSLGEHRLTYTDGPRWLGYTHEGVAIARGAA